MYKADILRFHYVPIEIEDEREADVFVRMKMPAEGAAYSNRVGEIEDAIMSYLDGVDEWGFEQLALDVATSFDPDAEIVVLTTFNI